jgi:Protein of unknown function (DUF3584)
MCRRLKGERVSSRLCKIYLVNTKTSGSTTSGRICEIDPRGGAAITGANGAGKTTTLQVIALFFGYSPTQLVQTGENRESMLRFILPHPESAIVFEYERADSPRDVCHVILRRESNSDVGEYRFVRGPMRKELFVAQDATGDTVFLDDEGTRQVAMREGQGEDFAAKLKLAAYRAVILNVPSAGKDNINRRNLASRFSFSRKPLAHLDRLVAAVIKEHLDFDDFSEVAATIVMDRVGSDVGQFAKDKQLQLRQSRGQIEQWLRDREAIDRAIRLEPEVKLLRDVIGEFRALDMRLGEKRTDCAKLTSINEGLLDQAQSDLEDLQVRRTQLQEDFSRRKTQLQEAIEQAQQAFSNRTNTYDVLFRKKRYLEDNDAPTWAKRTLDLEGLQGQAHALQEIVEAISNTARGVVNDYATKAQSVKDETGRKVEVMRKEHETTRARYDTEIATLAEQETQSLQEINGRFAPRMSATDQALEDCVGIQAQATAQVQRPGIDESLEVRLEHSRQSHQDHQNAVIEAQYAVSKVQNAYNEADREWSQAQRVHDSQKEHLTQAIKAVEGVKARLQPDPQSLHAAFLADLDAPWAETLGKVIDPALLTRVDLQPHFTGEKDALAYGWGINLAVIDRPKWVDQEDLKRQLEEASRAAQTSQGLLEEARRRFESAGSQRDKAAEELDLKQAALAVVQSKSGEFKSQLQAMQDTVAKARVNAKEEAQRRLEAAKTALESARKQLRQVKGAFEQEASDKRAEFAQQRDMAKRRRDDAIADVENRITTFQMRQSQAIKHLEQEREKELLSRGVDGEDLSRKENALSKLREDIREVEDHGPIAREWRDWQDNQGLSQLVDARETKDRAEEALNQANENWVAAEQLRREANATLGSEEAKIKQRSQSAESELSLLRAIAAELAEFAPHGVSTMTPNDQAGALKGQAHALLSDYRIKRQSLRTKSEKVDRVLCEGESSAREFVQGVMKEVTSDALDIDRASALVRVYDRIRPEVLVNVNLSLRTMLDGIKHYRETISDFESEVKKFNDKLQEGLKLVSSKFARFREFKVNVVSDLAKLDFIGKLKLLDDVIADHRARNSATYSIEVPSAQSAQALRTFMGALSSGSMEINLGKHITLSGSVFDDGVFKTFHSAKELEKISSNGLTAIALISLLSGLLNVIRGDQEIYIPWATDEVGRFDGGNFQHLMQMMAENKIDAVTASPALTPASYAYFAHRYVFKPQGVIAEYRPRTAQPVAGLTIATEVN